MMERKKIWWMIKKDLLTLWRHKVQFVSLILFPILMIALCGWGMGGTVENTPVVIVKQTSGYITDQAINAIKEDKTFEVKDILSDPVPFLIGLGISKISFNSSRNFSFVNFFSSL